MTTYHFKDLDKEDSYWLKRMETTHCMTALYYRLKSKLDEQTKKGLNVDDQLYLVEQLKAGIDLILLLENENRELKKK